MYSYEESQEETIFVNYKLKYKELKKHLRSLIYENECFQDELRKAQRNFLSISRDKSYLLDRILKYEKPMGCNSDSEKTESSENEEQARVNPVSAVQTPVPRKRITKRKRSEADLQNGASNQSNESFHGFVPSKVSKQTTPKNPAKTTKPRPKRPTARKNSTKKEKMADISSSYHVPHLSKGFNHMVEKAPGEPQQQLHMGRITDFDMTQKFEFASDVQMTREDIERRLEARRYSPELELNTTATMPAELFSHDAELESDLEDAEICDYIQMDDDGGSADIMI